MIGDFDRRRTLQELEEQDWGEPTFPSSLVTTCHRLRRKPLDQFTAQDLRILIGQQIGLPFLVPLAVERVEQNPLAEGDCYPADLLAALCGLGGAFWSSHLDSLQRVRRVLARVTATLQTVDENELQAARGLLKNAPRFLLQETAD